MIRRLVLTLFFAAFSATLIAAQPNVLSFQGRLHDVSIIKIPAGVNISATSDLIFVKTAEGKKYFCLPTSNQRGDYDSANQLFYMLDKQSGDIFSFAKIDGTLINLDGTFFSNILQDQQPVEIFSKPISIPSTEIPTDIAIMDNQRIAYRTDGPSTVVNTVPTVDEKVYVLTRNATATVELPTLIVPLLDADSNNNNNSVFIEWDAFNQTFLLLQNQLGTRNTDQRDRLTAIQRDGTITGTAFLTNNANGTPDTPDPLFPTYSGNAGGVAIDPETQIVYFLDPSTSQIFVLTPRQTQITQVAPNKGPAAGGTAVTLTGTNFPDDAQVFFDGIAATSVVVVSTTQITCVNPAHALGSVNITITGTNIPVATPATLVGGFTYINIPPNAVLQASPSRGPAPLSVNFSIDGIFDTDGTIANRVLDFGDGPPFTFPPNLAVTTTSHVYSAEGTYNAVLTVTDNLGGVATATKLIVVGDQLPLLVRTLSIKAANTEKDAMTLTGQFVLPEDFDITQAEVSVGFALPTAPALGDFSATDAPEFTENPNGGQYDGKLVPTKNGKTGKLSAKQMKFTYKPYKRLGVTPSTFTFSFSGRGFALTDALQNALLKPDGTNVLFDDPKGPTTLATLTLIVRIAAGADVLNFKKQAVVKINPSKSTRVTLTRN